MVLSGEDEEVLWWLLQRHAAPPTALSAAAGAPDAAPAALGEPCLNYDAFSQVAAECREAIGPSADLYFQAGGSGRGCSARERTGWSSQQRHNADGGTKG